MSFSKNSATGVFKMSSNSCVDGLFMPIAKNAERRQMKIKHTFGDSFYIFETEQCDAFDQSVLFSLIAQAELSIRQEKEAKILDENNISLSCLYEKMGGRTSVYYKTTMYKIAQDCFGNIRPNTTKYRRLHESLNRLSKINVRVHQKVNGKIIRGSYSLISYTSIEDIETGKTDVYVSFSEFFSRMLAGYINQFTLIDFFERSKLSSFGQLLYSYLCFAVRPKGKIKNWNIDGLIKHIYNIEDIYVLDRKILYKYRKNIISALKEIDEKTNWKAHIDGHFFSVSRPAVEAETRARQEAGQAAETALG